jgi:hypothetical protein
VAAEGISKVMNNAVDNPVIQRNIHTIRACLDAHNRQDMKAFDFYAEDIEIIEMPTGVTYKGMGSAVAANSTLPANPSILGRLASRKLPSRQRPGTPDFVPTSNTISNRQLP